MLGQINSSCKWQSILSSFYPLDIELKIHNVVLIPNSYEYCLWCYNLIIEIFSNTKHFILWNVYKLIQWYDLYLMIIIIYKMINKIVKSIDINFCSKRKKSIAATFYPRQWHITRTSLMMFYWCMKRDLVIFVIQ